MVTASIELTNRFMKMLGFARGVFMEFDRNLRDKLFPAHAQLSVLVSYTECRKEIHGMVNGSRISKTLDLVFRTELPVMKS